MRVHTSTIIYFIFDVTKNCTFLSKRNAGNRNGTTKFPRPRAHTSKPPAPSSLPPSLERRERERARAPPGGRNNYIHPGGPSRHFN